MKKWLVRKLGGIPIKDLEERKAICMTMISNPRVVLMLTYEEYQLHEYFMNMWSRAR